MTIAFTLHSRNPAPRGALVAGLEVDVESAATGTRRGAGGRDLAATTFHYAALFLQLIAAQKADLVECLKSF